MNRTSPQWLKKHYFVVDVENMKKHGIPFSLGLSMTGSTEKD